MASTFAVNLLLIGFASATCSIFFCRAAGRRLFMAVALACAVGIVVVSLMGLYRILLLAALAYLVRDWWNERRNAREKPRPARAAQAAALLPRKDA